MICVQSVHQKDSILIIYIISALCEYMIKSRNSAHKSSVNIVSDHALGILVLIATTSTLIYYTSWLLIVPFFENSHTFRNLFFHRYIGQVISVILFTISITICTTFIGLLLIRTKDK